MIQYIQQVNCVEVFMKKVCFITGDNPSSVEKKGIENLTELILDYTFEYPICIKCDEESNLKNYLKIYIGTQKSNPYIKNLSDFTFNHPEEYHIKVSDDTAIIEGSDENGVLYGCIDFYNKYLLSLEYPHTDKFRINPFEEGVFPEYECSSFPAISQRGLWTWGHVIYDYKGYIDNMIKLKMNSIIIWNDYPPVNSKEMIDYAHLCGIKIFFGYEWGWDTDCNVFDLSAIHSMSETIFEKYEKDYAHLGLDGIYFQSFTELNKEDIGGILIADAVTQLVNNTSKLFFEKYPNINLLFGLHATSVKEKLQYIKNTDKRIRIIWENCGAFPFKYLPSETEDFDKTCEFTKKILTLRGKDDLSGAVTKGLVKLDWLTFTHLEGAHLLGVSSKNMKRNRVERKRKIWKYVQAYWLTNANYAYDMVKLFKDCTKGNTSIYALVEDGMFEENIMYPVALYSELLWDTDTDINSIIPNVALRDYVTFA